MTSEIGHVTREWRQAAGVILHIHSLKAALKWRSRSAPDSKPCGGVWAGIVCHLPLVVLLLRGFSTFKHRDLDYQRRTLGTCLSVQLTEGVPLVLPDGLGHVVGEVFRDASWGVVILDVETTWNGPWGGKKNTFAVSFNNEIGSFKHCSDPKLEFITRGPCPPWGSFFQIFIFSVQLCF